MTTTPKPEPASDEEIADTFSRANWVTAIGSVRALKLIARIEADRATIAKQAEEIERLGAALGTLESRLFGLGEQTPICRVHRAGLSAMVDFIRAILAHAKEGEQR